VDLDRDADFIGKQALLKVRAEGVNRRLSGFVIEGDRVLGSQHPLPLRQEERTVGSISEIAYSPRLQQNIGIGLVSNTVADNATNLTVAADDIPRKASLAALPFIR
jgi:aminomethyltransferase